VTVGCGYNYIQNHNIPCSNRGSSQEGTIRISLREKRKTKSKKAKKGTKPGGNDAFLAGPWPGIDQEKSKGRRRNSMEFTTVALQKRGSRGRLKRPDDCSRKIKIGRSTEIASWTLSRTQSYRETTTEEKNQASGERSHEGNIQRRRQGPVREEKDPAKVISKGGKQKWKGQEQ